MQIKSFADTMGYLRKHMLNGSENSSRTPAADESSVNYSQEVQPVVIRKTPKFPSRERHLAIRRKKAADSPDSQRSEVLDMCVDSSDESSVCSCENE